MPLKQNDISSTDSVWIDKQLAAIKTEVDNHDNYWFTNDPKAALSQMREAINDLFDDIFKRIES